MSLVVMIRDGSPDEAHALETLQRRASDVWPEYREQLAAHPDAITPPHRAIAKGRVRIAIDASGRRLGFSTVLPVRGGSCELDDLFVEPEVMRAGVGRALVEDAAARAQNAGVSRLGVIANPNALPFYTRLGFDLVGNAPTRFGDAPRMSLFLGRRADAAAVAGVMHDFFRAVSFGPDSQPAYDKLHDLFSTGSRLMKLTGSSLGIWSVDEFVRTRRAAYATGEMRAFHEAELGARTQIFGNLAHRSSQYGKQATTASGTVDTRGAISTGFLKTDAGWRVSSMAWADDDRTAENSIARLWLASSHRLPVWRSVKFLHNSSDSYPGLVRSTAPEA